MIKLFLTKVLNNLKKPISWIKENIHFFNAAFPGLLTNIFVVLFYYGIWKALSLIPWSVKLDNAYNTISSTIWSYLALSDIWFILIVLGLVLLDSISKFLNKRKIAKRPPINTSPIIGIPNKDNVTVLLMLFNLRCLEIGRLYSTVQAFQKEADEQGVKGNWVGLFLMDYFESDFYSRDYCPYSYESDEKKEERIRQDKEAISNLLKEKFDLSVWQYSGYNNSSYKDLLIVFKQWAGIYSVKRLEGINMYGQLSNTISALIESYKKFNSADSIIFIHDKPFTRNLKFEVINSHGTIDEIWKEIIFALKSSLIFLKMQNDTFFDIEKIFKEINVLDALQCNIAIQATMELVRFSSNERPLALPSKKDVNLILNKLRPNPLNDLY